MASMTAPRLQIKDGGTYGIHTGFACKRHFQPACCRDDYYLRLGSICQHGIPLHAWDRVRPPGLQQRFVLQNIGTRELDYTELRKALIEADVYLEN